MNHYNFVPANEQAMSNEYVKEYKIPTACTQPLAIIVDHDGLVWFAQTNTGKIAKFDPLTETFTEYDNPVWNKYRKNIHCKPLLKITWTARQNYVP